GVIGRETPGPMTGVPRTAVGDLGDNQDGATGHARIDPTYQDGATEHRACENSAIAPGVPATLARSEGSNCSTALTASEMLLPTLRMAPCSRSGSTAATSRLATVNRSAGRIRGRSAAGAPMRIAFMLFRTASRTR